MLLHNPRRCVRGNRPLCFLIANDYPELQGQLIRGLWDFFPPPHCLENVNTNVLVVLALSRQRLKLNAIVTKKKMLKGRDFHI